MIARYANEGSHYASGLSIARGFPLTEAVAGTEHLEALRVAYLIARDLKLVE